MQDPNDRGRTDAELDCYLPGAHALFVERDDVLLGVERECRLWRVVVGRWVLRFPARAHQVVVQRGQLYLLSGV